MIVKNFVTYTALIFVLIAISGCTTAQLIRPVAVWPDNRGQHVQAHGGGIIKLGNTYYWFGEDRSRSNDPNYRYVACYTNYSLRLRYSGDAGKLDGYAKTIPFEPA